MKTNTRSGLIPAAYSVQGRPDAVLPSGAYTLLLHKIAAAFGFTETECCVLVEEVLLRPNILSAADMQDDELKLLLVKDMIRQCVFKKGCELFSRNLVAAHSWSAKSKDVFATPTREIPLSYQTVYILFYSIGFHETKIAEILNISPLQVRERLGKAEKRIGKDAFFGKPPS